MRGVFSLRWRDAGTKRVAVVAEAENQAGDVHHQQNDRRPEAQTIDLFRVGLERSKAHEVEDRWHHERHDREKQHDRRRSGRRAIELLRSVREAAHDAGESEDEEKIADDAAGNRRLDDRRVVRAERRDGDDQLGGVSERGIQEAAESWAGALRQLIGRRTDQARCRNE